MFYLGGVVREYRQRVAPGLSAAEFSEEVGISASELSKIETNKRPLTMTHVLMITLTYNDKSLYYQFRKAEEEYIFECFSQRKLVSV